MTVINVSMAQCKTGLSWTPYTVNTRAPSQYTNALSRYGNLHYKVKTVIKLSYIYNGNTYTGKTASLQRNCPQGLLLLKWFNLNLSMDK